MKNIFILLILVSVIAIAGCTSSTQTTDEHGAEVHATAENVEHCFEDHVDDSFEETLEHCKEEICGTDEHCMEEVEELAPSPVGGKNYVGNSPEECATIQVLCVEGLERFDDETGCGCQPI